MEPGDWISIAALVLAIFASMGSVYNWYESRFRYTEVLAWSLDSIRSMQKLSLLLSKQVMARSVREDPSAEDSKELENLEIEISTHIEVGRVFFKNSPGTGSLRNWGNDKPPAYQGIRPRILDYLVAAYDAAREWRGASTSRREELAEAVVEAERQFVSLVQCEVGRAKTSSVKTRQRGKGSPLNWIVEDVRARRSKP